MQENFVMEIMFPVRIRRRPRARGAGRVQQARRPGIFLASPFEAPPAPAPALEAAVAQQRRRRVRALRGGFGRNAGRAVKTGLGIHAGSCAERGRSASPASAETVAAFVDAMAATRLPATLDEIHRLHW